MPTTTLRIAMLGMKTSNDHPYSWSALINSLDREAMSHYPNSTILNYLGPLAKNDLLIAGLRNRTKDGRRVNIAEIS